MTTLSKSSETNKHYDLVVVGSGIAGLFAAITAARDGRLVVVVTKAGVDETNTRYAQGGMAAALGDGDSPERHWRDTISCGGDLNDCAAVDVLTREAGQCVADLMDLGIGFDSENGQLARTREAAHSVARVVHAGGDATGLSIQQGLMAALHQLAVPIIPFTTVSELIVFDGRVVGVATRSNGKTENICADHVLLATGGAGQLYSRTTNPAIATGDGLALAYRAGADLMDLEFFQFHPTALALPGRPAFLISEAVRGEGGVLLNRFGEAFMQRHHRDADLAPRDVVSRAIWREIGQTSMNHVFLDLTQVDGSRLASRFPTIYAYCRDAGIDITTQPIPVAPAAHYFMGGILADMDGKTSLPGLLAAGEVACTAVHGANRLASNSLLEGLVAGRRTAQNLDRERTVDIFHGSSGRVIDPSDRAIVRRVRSRADLQSDNWRKIGIVRTHADLANAARALDSVGDSANTTKTPDDENLTIVSSLIAQAALARTESRGAHFRSDFPSVEDKWKGHIIASRDGLRFVPAPNRVSEPVPA